MAIKKKEIEQDILNELNQTLMKPLSSEKLNFGELAGLLEKKLDVTQTTAIAINGTLAKLWDVTEPDVRRGKKVLESAKAGHEAVYGTEEEKDERRKEILEACLQLHQENPHLSVTSIRIKVSQRLGLSSKTIQRATPGLKELIKHNK